MAFDLPRVLRVLKPQRRTRKLERRADSQLQWIDDVSRDSRPILLDTCVYIDVLQGRSPASVDAILNSRASYHSCVCLAELMHPFGRLNPAHPNTKAALEIVSLAVSGIAVHRLYAPDGGAWALAGVLAGELARLTEAPLGMERERRILNDALIATQARGLGVEVLTANVRDFDFLGQLLPGLRVLNYHGNGAATA